MEIIQKKRTHKYTFTFRDEQFNYHYEDRAGSGDLDMYYADFPFKSSIRIDRNDWLRNVGFLWIAIGLLILGLGLVNAGQISLDRGFWLILGIGCLVWAHYSNVRFSVFSGDRGSVWIIQDGKHDTILDALMTRRTAQLLKWHGEVNPDNDRAKEIDKFRWLADRGVITQEECDNKIAQVELLHRDKPVEAGERLN